MLSDSRVFSSDGDFARSPCCARLALLLTAVVLAEISQLPVRSNELNVRMSNEELVVVLIENLSTIDSLYCEYEFATVGEKKKSKSSRYARSGSQWHFADEIENGQMTRTFSCDNEFTYLFDVHADQSDEEVIHQLTLRDPSKIDGITLNPDELIGQCISNIASPLTDLLAVYKDTLIQTTNSDGDISLHFTVASSDQHRYELTVIFDPKHDYLPREILAVQPDEEVTLPGWKQHWKILQYQRVLDESSGLDRWFPAEALLDQGDAGAPSFRMTVHKARINPVLDNTLFQPDIPDGVLVVDATSSGNSRVAFKGNHRVIFQRINSLTDTSLDKTSRPWLILANAMFVAILLVLVFGRRYNNKKSL